VKKIIRVATRVIIVKDQVSNTWRISRRGDIYVTIRRSWADQRMQRITQPLVVVEDSNRHLQKISHKIFSFFKSYIMSIEKFL